MDVFMLRVHGSTGAVFIHGRIYTQRARCTAGTWIWPGMVCIQKMQEQFSVCRSSICTGFQPVIRSISVYQRLCRFIESGQTKGQTRRFVVDSTHWGLTCGLTPLSKFVASQVGALFEQALTLTGQLKLFKSKICLLAQQIPPTEILGCRRDLPEGKAPTLKADNKKPALSGFFISVTKPYAKSPG